MLSKSTGSASTWSAAVAPWRSTIIRPPARRACASSLSSAIAERAPRPNSAAAPAANSTARNVLRDPMSMRILRGSVDQEHAFAGGLGVEQLVGLVRLVELPAVGEQFFDVDLAVDDELRALGLTDLREGPRRDDCQLLPEHVGADIDRHLVALADKAGRAPHFRGAHRGDAPFRLARRIEREFGAVTLRQILDRADRVVGARVDGFPGAELLGALETLLADIERDDPRPHRVRQLRRGEADRPLPEDRDRVIARQLDPAQRAIGRAGAAGDRRTRHK